MSRFPKQRMNPSDAERASPHGSPQAAEAEVEENTADKVDSIKNQDTGYSLEQYGSSTALAIGVLYRTLLTEDWDSCARSCRRFKFRLGNFPERINNLYFAFVFMLRSVCSLFCHCCPVTSLLRAPVTGLSRAVNKAADVLLAYDYSTGRTAEDAEVASSMQEMYVS